MALLPAITSPHRTPGAQGARVPRSIFALLFVSILLPLLLFALAAAQNRRDVEHAARLRVERTTRLLHEHALKVFETHQLLIDQINERLRTLDWSNDANVENLHERLLHLKALLPQIASIIVTDADGNLRADSSTYPADKTLNFADRDYFKMLKAADQVLPYISRAVMARNTGDPVFNMAARAAGPVPGQFNGVVSISVNQGYFTDFYRGAERDFAHVVLLVRKDGAILASEPPIGSYSRSRSTLYGLQPRLAPETLHVGFVEADGTRRIFGSEQVGPYPVVIGLGVTFSSAMLPWWQNIRGYGLVAALSSLALLAVSGFAIRRVILEGRATVRWRKAAALLQSEMAQRASIEEQLRQSQKMEAVGRLTGGIAHDFNNLLTIVMGSLDLLLRRMPHADERQRGLIKNAVDGASRAAALTARLLAFSRQQPLDPKAVDANVLIGDMSGLLQRTLGETIAIEWRRPPGALPIFADPNQLENAILNLCVNAVDAMPRGGTLTIATAALDLAEGEGTAAEGAAPHLSPGPYVTISVEDTGTGMAPEVLTRVFEPFYTTKPVGKGTGLGLSQVYGFARQSGGDVAIRSRPEAGTSVTIRLPRHLAAPDAASPSSLSASAGAVMPARFGTATVLVVEDEALVRAFAATALRDAGYTVVEAGTGPEGLARLREVPGIDLLFTDVVLKGPMNGRELADAAAEIRPDMPVLFTTGYTKDAIVHDGRLDEGICFIAKPFTTSALTAKIEDLLDQAATARARLPIETAPLVD